MKNKDILLLLLYSPGLSEDINEPIKGRTRLMKMMFIFQNEIYIDFKFDRKIERENLSDFFAWKFGPFSYDVLNDIEFFKRIGLIRVDYSKDSEIIPEESIEYKFWKETTYDLDENNDELYDYIEEIFILSEIGIKYIEDTGIYTSLSNNQKEVIRKFKKTMNESPLYKILDYVYTKYPEMTEKSEIAYKF